jgi:adenylate cyclase
MGETASDNEGAYGSSQRHRAQGVTQVPDEVPARDRVRRDKAESGWQVSLKTLLPGALAVLVVLAVIPVIAVGYFFASDTAQRLLTERAELIVDGLENEIRGVLDPVAAQLDHARRAVMRGEIDPDDGNALRSFVLGLLAGTPQAVGVGHVRPDLSMRRWERESFAEIIEPAGRLPLAAHMIEAARAGESGYWSKPFISTLLRDAILSYRVTLEHDGQFHGVLVTATTGDRLSRYVAETSRLLNVTAFVLAGRDRVIAYPGRPALDAREIASNELPPLSSVSDSVLARIWDDPRPFTQIDEPTRSRGHWSPIGGTPYVYFYRELTGYGPDPLLVGVTYPAADSRRDRWAPTIAAGVGLLLMLLAAAAAWRLGRALVRPATEFGGALNAIAGLEFDQVALPGLVNSRVREWRAMARTVVNTAGALSAFQTYLPRALVRRLFQSSGAGVASRQRDITVMFADLEGFTVFSRGQEAGAVAAYLNDVFALIGPVVEQSGGVIDKYTGDGLLAFWGAPDEQPDHAARACRAAAEIARLMVRNGNDSVQPRLRIGLHSGPAIVGNIGFPGRINYTLVGDTVNLAERTEAAMRGVAPERLVAIGATQAVLEAQGDGNPSLIPGPVLSGAPRPAFLCYPAPAPAT